MKINGKKTKIMIAASLLMIACLAQIIVHKFNYHKIKTGVVIDKYHFNDQSSTGSTDDLILVVKYPDVIIKKYVDANAFYSYNIKGTVSFDEIERPNYLSMICGVLACFIFVFLIIFPTEYTEPVKEKEKIKQTW